MIDKMFLIILRKGVIEDVMDFIVFRKFFVIRFFVNVFVVFSFVWIEIIIVGENICICI